MIENNRVNVTGELISEFKFSHEVYGEGFYLCDLAVKRLSGKKDSLPLMVSDRLLDVTKDYRGHVAAVSGQFRSYNRHDGEKTSLVLSVFVREIEFMDEPVDQENNNQISLNGYICKEPIYRKTPLGRDIADLLLAVNRPYGKSDYIPCIAWGRNASYVSSLNVGEHIILLSRVQSRKYQKKRSETEVEERTAYEVSISRLEVIK